MEVGDMNAPVRASTIDPLLHPQDAAKILNVSTSWLAKARLSGDGPRFVKIGRAVRYLESSLREYIKGRTRGSTSEK
jgi:predicted DNA-binding transcriptional regulator AlpA